MTTADSSLEIGATRPRPWSRHAGVVIPPLLVFIAAIGLWELIIEVFEIQRFLLPRPSEIASLFVEDFVRLIRQGRNTLGVAGRGLLLGGGIGIGLAAITFRTRWMAEGIGIYRGGAQGRAGDLAGAAHRGLVRD